MPIFMHRLLYATHELALKSLLGAFSSPRSMIL